MCFGMHCVGTAVIAAKATKEQVDRYLVPIAAGQHITTLALSETGSGVILIFLRWNSGSPSGATSYLGRSNLSQTPDMADSYVISCIEATQS